ncbi:terminase large subunit [Agrobacterium rhizogenes]|uniref:terminase large subunit n=1 Tax=Rhizobium rhizogenes TaxID=359 RepID=UPI001574D5E8|nr:terminase TerL endonuclease subunit [Rhizobium rhizogenes]NTF80837.1 terminase large subunit [Rhizobium rhizogenes]NTI01896.1 terminase large subunit [Rhizobium rhizogenes]NTI08699.1 terminase large subunit [Rhizobium rhizogenes]
MDGVSTAAIEASAGAQLWPEPEWIKEAADNRGWEWARIAWRRCCTVAGAWFDYAKADAAVQLFPDLFRLTEDRFAGKPFRLGLWQEIIVRLLVGWKAPNEIIDEQTGEPTVVHVRIFRRLMLWVPRKNGKSEFLAALSLLFFIVDGVVGGQGFVFARDEKQARIIFDKMKAMISMSPSLGDAQLFKKSIYLPKIRALFELLSGKPEGKHGKSPTVITGDEMHEWETPDLANFLRQGTGARLEPIELYASTAGVKSNKTGYALWEESQSILDGRIDDPTTLVVIFALAVDDDWESEANWSKANPSLGISPTVQFLRREAAIAKDNPRAEAHFRCYHANQWIDAVVRWLNLKKWDACAADKTVWQKWRDGEGLEGRKCLSAFDVSANQDITARILAFPPDETTDRWILSAKFWVPEAIAPLRTKRDRISYDQWVKMGAIETTPGDYVDQSYVQHQLEDDLERYDVELMGYDPWNAVKLYTDLVKGGVDEERFLKMRQGIPTLGEPTKLFERLVMAGKLDHGGHPVLRWMAGNTAVKFDDNLNYAPTKKKSAEKIDGIVAAVMAVGLSMADSDDGADIGDFLKNAVTA